MKIAVGGDHRGAGVIRSLAESLRRDGYDVVVMGDCSGATVDYPDVAYLVASAVSRGEVDRAVLVCGTGIGMCMAANKLKGVRAAQAHDELTAEMSRSHNDANVLCLSADLLGQRRIEAIVKLWLKTEFEGGRHARRVNKIAVIESGGDPSKA